MDALPPAAGDLNDLERRLSDWQPSVAGLDAGRMLFAAGQNSVRPGWGRVAWPVVSACLALVVVALGVVLGQERTARLELAAQLRNHAPAVVPVPYSTPEAGTVAAEEPPDAASYLAGRRALSENLDAWLLLAQREPSPGPPAPSRPIWNANSRAEVLDP